LQKYRKAANAQTCKKKIWGKEIVGISKIYQTIFRMKLDSRNFLLKIVAI